MGRLGQLVSRAIDLLHKARFVLDQGGAGEAVAAVERALAAATFARAAVLQAEKITAAVGRRKSILSKAAGPGRGHPGPRRSSIGRRIARR
jgi:hypothetical protein